MRPIRFCGDPFSISGYSEHIRELMLALLDAGADLSLNYIKQAPVDLPGPYVEKLKPLVNRKNGATLDVYVTVPPAMQKSNEQIVAYTTFETNTLPRGWAQVLNQTDLVMVPSTFNLRTFADAGVIKPIEVCFEGYDPAVYNPAVKPWKLNVDPNSYKFFSVLEWTPRKSWDRLLAAYWTEFSFEDNVSLILKVSGPQDDPNFVNFIRNGVNTVKQMMGLGGNVQPYKRPAPVYIIYNPLRPDEMAGLHIATNAFVSASHGEGFNRGALHSAACNRPVVAVDWSGHKDFLNESNSYLADYFLEPCISPVNAMGNYTPDMRWAEVSITDLGQKMRECYNDVSMPKVADVTGMTWANSAKAFMEIINAKFPN